MKLSCVGERCGFEKCMRVLRQFGENVDWDKLNKKNWIN